MEPTEENKCCESKKCCCFCHKMPGLFIILAGAAVLLRALEVLGSKPFWITIAVLMILAGLQVMARGACKCCNGA